MELKLIKVNFKKAKFIKIRNLIVLKDKVEKIIINRRRKMLGIIRKIRDYEKSVIILVIFHLIFFLFINFLFI
jgi:hypothetical protein